MASVCWRLVVLKTKILPRMRQRQIAADFSPQMVCLWEKKSRMGRQQTPIGLAFVPFGTSNHPEKIHLTLKREATRFRAFGTDNCLLRMSSGTKFREEQQKKRPAEQDAFEFSIDSSQRLTLRELRASTSTVKTRLLTLFHT